MNTRFKKLALATAVAAGLTTVSLPSQAYVLGSAGDALLIPLVVWGNGTPNSPPTQPESEYDDVNTIIEVTVPSSIGHESVANIFTARWSTPTNANLALTPADPDLTKPSTARLRWFWFDKESIKRKDGIVPVTPDDVVQFNWREMAGGSNNNNPGYMVISTVTASTRAAADFAMFGQAYLVSGVPGISASIPVLPLKDGVDTGVVGEQPTADNNVVYGSNGIPTAVSPLVSGSRTSYADGDKGDIWVFDLMLSDRTWPTIQVVWLDQNTGYGPKNPVAVNVFDTEEHWCSDNIPVPYELTVTLITPYGTTVSYPSDGYPVFGGSPLQIPETTAWFTQIKDGLCAYGLDLDADAENVGGYVQYLMNEYKDAGSMTAESSGVAFSLKYGEIPDEGVASNFERRIYADTALANDRGMFK